MTDHTTSRHERAVLGYPFVQQIPTVRRAAVGVWLHWITVLLLALGVSAIFLREAFDGKAERLLLLNIHRGAGLLILTVVCVRIAIRCKSKWRKSNSRLPAIMKLLASATHAVLYLLLIALPILGWALTNSQGRRVTALGFIPLPSIAAPSTDLADRLAAYHAYAAWVLLGLAVLHVLAALWHHFVLRDGLLYTMLPGHRYR